MRADMRTWTEALPFFERRELDCQGSRQIDSGGHPIPGSGVILLDIRFACHFPVLRVSHGAPLTTNSVCRTPAHNVAVDGHPSSMHLTENPKWPTWGCMGADIRWHNWSAQEQLDFARLAWRLGWAVGLHDLFCHVDRRADLGNRALPKRVFLYGSWSSPFDPEDIK